MILETNMLYVNYPSIYKKERKKPEVDTNPRSSAQWLWGRRALLTSHPFHPPQTSWSSSFTSSCFSGPLLQPMAICFCFRFFCCFFKFVTPQIKIFGSQQTLIELSICVILQHTSNGHKITWILCPTVRMLNQLSDSSFYILRIYSTVGELSMHSAHLEYLFSLYVDIPKLIQS